MAFSNLATRNDIPINRLPADWLKEVLGNAQCYWSRKQKLRETFPCLFSRPIHLLEILQVTNRLLNSK